MSMGAVLMGYFMETDLLNTSYLGAGFVLALDAFLAQQTYGLILKL